MKRYNYTTTEHRQIHIYCIRIYDFIHTDNYTYLVVLLNSYIIRTVFRNYEEQPTIMQP